MAAVQTQPSADREASARQVWAPRSECRGPGLLCPTPTAPMAQTVHGCSFEHGKSASDRLVSAAANPRAEREDGSNGVARGSLGDPGKSCPRSCRCSGESWLSPAALWERCAGSPGLVTLLLFPQFQNCAAFQGRATLTRGCGLFGTNNTKHGRSVQKHECGHWVSQPARDPRGPATQTQRSNPAAVRTRAKVPVDPASSHCTPHSPWAINRRRFAFSHPAPSPILGTPSSCLTLEPLVPMVL